MFFFLLPLWGVVMSLVVLSPGCLSVPALFFRCVCFRFFGASVPRPPVCPVCGRWVPPPFVVPRSGFLRCGGSL